MGLGVCTVASHADVELTASRLNTPAPPPRWDPAAGSGAFPAGRLSQAAPTADLVGGSLGLLEIDKGLRQHDRMAPAGLPVRAEPLEHGPHEAADQVGVLATRDAATTLAGLGTGTHTALGAGEVQRCG